MINYPDCRHFEKEEYDNRIKRAQLAIQARGADALLVHSLANICWLCGLECIMPGKYFMMVVPANGKPKLLIQNFESHNAYINTYLPEEDIVQYLITEDYAEDYIFASAELIKKMKLVDSKLLIEIYGAHLSVNCFMQLKQLLPDVCFEDSRMCIEKVRIIKTSEEIVCMRKAAIIASQGIKDVVDAAKEGMTDNEMAAIACNSMLRAGSEYMCLDPIITIGKRSGIPHTTYSRVPTQSGDTVLLEFGACYKRYTAVTMRTISIGKPDDTVRILFDAAKRSVENIIAKMRPGMDGSDIADSSKATILKETEKWLWHGCYGYSIGLGFPPSWEDGPAIIRQGAHFILEPGMVFHTSTTFRDIARYGVTVSETVLVTQNGCEVLTDVPRRLFIK